MNISFAFNLLAIGVFDYANSISVLKIIISLIQNCDFDKYFFVWISN